MIFSIKHTLKFAFTLIYVTRGTLKTTIFRICEGESEVSRVKSWP